MHVTFLCKPSLSYLILQVWVSLLLSMLKLITSHTVWNWEYSFSAFRGRSTALYRSSILLCSLSINQNEAVALYNCCEMRKASKTYIWEEELLLSQQIKETESVVLASTGEPERSLSSQGWKHQMQQVGRYLPYEQYRPYTKNRL